MKTSERGERGETYINSVSEYAPNPPLNKIPVTNPPTVNLYLSSLVRNRPVWGTATDGGRPWRSGRGGGGGGGRWAPESGGGLSYDDDDDPDACVVMMRFAAAEEDSGCVNAGPDSDADLSLLTHFIIFSKCSNGAGWNVSDSGGGKSFARFSDAALATST